jgi:hypothetical protein
MLSPVSEVITENVAILGVLLTALSIIVTVVFGGSCQRL